MLPQLLQQVFTAPLFRIGEASFSLANILQILVSIVCVALLARLLARVLKLVVLGRLGVNRGVAEAIGTMFSYSFTAIGAIVVLHAAGINLGSLAVVAGFLGLGLGIGLQNLASNFASGLVLLFEQPIKVGDYIEVGDLLGTVERISIRATVVRTVDDVFVIVPNNQLTESNIINWSYQRPRCRIHIPVGVAYNSDPVLVTEALLAAARTEPRVLTFPAPTVWLNGFGENALNFSLLVWIDRPDESSPIRSAVNFAIEYEFRRRGIHIPFPQRDIHLHADSNLGALLSARSPASVNGPGEGAKPASTPSQGRSLRELLRRISYFANCTHVELLEIVTNGQRRVYPAEAVICRENDSSDAFYIILSGSVAVFSERVGHDLATLHAGEFFGEISVLTGTPRTATVRALEETTLFEIDRQHLQRLLAKRKDLAEDIARQLAERKQTLIGLGLLTEDELRANDDSALAWVRRRLNDLFGIQLGKS